MSDGPDAETKEVAVQKPVTLKENPKVLKVAKNLQAVYEGHQEGPNRESDIRAREAMLKRSGVDRSWYSEEEFTGKDGTTPWPNILEEARDNDFRRQAANKFEGEADLGRPISEEKNLGLLKEMSSFEQRQARDKAEEKRQERINAEREKKEKEKREKENRERIMRHNQEVEERMKREKLERELERKAEEEKLRQKVEEAKGKGVAEGQRLAGRVYDPKQRANVDTVLDSIVTANTKRKGILGNNSDEVREQLLEEIDSSRGLRSYSSLGRKYEERRRKEIKKTSKREPRWEEMSEITKEADSVMRDVSEIRSFESEGSIKRPPREVTRTDSIFHEKASRLGDFYDTTAEREHGEEKAKAWNDGFRGGYNSVRESYGSFSDENRPWFMPSGQAQGDKK